MKHVTVHICHCHRKHIRNSTVSKLKLFQCPSKSPHPHFTIQSIRASYIPQNYKHCCATRKNIYSLLNLHQVQSHTGLIWQKQLRNDLGSKTTWPALTINMAVKSFYLCLIFCTSASIWRSYTREKREHCRNMKDSFALLPAFHTPHVLLHTADLRKVKHLRIHQFLSYCIQRANDQTMTCMKPVSPVDVVYSQLKQCCPVGCFKQ